MDEINLLTQKDLAERWKVSYRTIGTWVKDGTIQPVKGLPIIRFTEQHILELEGVKLDRMSPLERRKLENEIGKLLQENQKLKSIIRNILAEASLVINL